MGEVLYPVLRLRDVFRPRAIDEGVKIDLFLNCNFLEKVYFIFLIVPSCLNYIPKPILEILNKTRDLKRMFS